MSAVAPQKRDLVPREDVACCGVCGSPERAPFYPPADVVECLGCGVLYVSPRPTAEAIAEFYSRQGHYEQWDKEKGRDDMWRRRTERIRRMVPSGKLLDIGTGQGDFGAIARSVFDVDGTEVSSEGARQAKERHGLDIRVGDALDLDLPKGGYDVVTMWHVLEHVAEPRRLLLRAKELVRPGGVVAVAVPNTDWRLALTRARARAAVQFAMKQRPNRAIPFARLELDRPEEELHLTHFTLTTLVRLVEACGLTIADAGLDDYSAQPGLRPRLDHAAAELLYRATKIPYSAAIFAAGRKPS